MEEKDLNKIVTDAWLKARGFSDSWISRHATACGVIARRPRRFLLSRILAHLDELAERSVAKANGKRKGREASKQAANEIFGEFTRKQKQKTAMNGSGVLNFAEYYRKSKKGGE